MPTLTKSDWDNRYVSGDTPWDSGVPSKELIRVLDEERISPCRALELGCGSGTNSVYLAQRGFNVTAIDFSHAAIERAKGRAAGADVQIDFREADVTHFTQSLSPFDFIFDRGCYHTVRRDNVAGFLRTLRQLSQPGTMVLVLAGNSNEQHPGGGPPSVYEHELRIDFQPLFDVQWIREFRFEVPAPPEGFLAWSCFMSRRAE